MSSQTATVTYAASSFGGLNYSAVTVTEVDTVPAADFSAVSGFITGINSSVAAAPVTGTIATATSYSGLSWAAFNTGVFAPGETVTLNFSYTVSSSDPALGISSLENGFTSDFLSLPGGITATATETASSGGVVVGQFTSNLNAALGTSASGTLALGASYSSLQINVSYTFSASALAAVGVGIDISALNQGFQTAPVSPSGSIGDFAFLDLNGNGTFDAGDVALSGVTVDLLNASGTTVLASMVTDASGAYNFSGLAAGGYEVKFIAPTGLAFTTQVASVAGSTVSAANTATGVTSLINLSAGQHIVNEDVGFVMSGNNGGGGTGVFTTHVYLDTNADSSQGVGETNVAGVTVALLNGSGVPTGQTAVTDANGNVSFSNLTAGTYQVAVTTPAGDGVTQHTNVGTPVAVAAGQTVAAVEGLYVPAAFTTHVYFDSNADGVQNAGDSNLAGVTVALLNGSGVATGQTAITDANGNVTFSGLVPGSYEVGITTPAGDVVKQTTNVMTPTTLVSGQTANAIEGVYAPACLTTHVYFDSNADGVQGAGDTNLAGVTVALLNGSGVPTGTTAITDANGNVKFAGLVPGSYQVAVTTPAGDIVKQTTNIGTPITLLAGQTAAAVEGLYAPSAFTTHVYLDRNADGVQNAGDSNLAGVTVALLNGSGVATGQTAITDANGNVSFTNLTPGSYEVAVTTPAGDIVKQMTNVMTPTTVLAGQTGTAIEGVYAPAAFTTHVYFDSNADGVQNAGDSNLAGVTVALLNGSGVATGQTAITDANGNVSFIGLVPGSYEVSVTTPAGDIVRQMTNVMTPTTLASGQTGSAIEGVYLPACITTHVYFDSNADGTQGAGETNLAGVTVALLNGSGVPTGTTAVTDAAGNVKFAGLVPGSYQVAITTPAGDIVKQATNVGAPITLTAGQTVAAVEGLYVPAAFTTHVYFDSNADGVQGVGETNLAGVTVALLNGSGVATGQTAITDANGNVTFAGLVPGSYEVAVTTPAGDIVKQMTNVMTPTTLLAGQTGNAIEGVYAPAAFTTHVYFDSNADGVQGVGETNLAGVTVALLNGSGVATGQTAITDANGNVTFAGLVPGSYEVAVTTPAGDVVTQHTNVMTPTTLLAGQTGIAIEGLHVPDCFTQGTNGLTIGYWKQHQSRWDDVPDASSTDVLYASPNHGHSGPNGAVGVLLGDINGNGVTDSGETTLFLSLASARILIDPSNFQGSDAHQILLKQLIAAQLNVYNGAHAPGWQPGTDIVGTDVITESVKFLRGMGPFVGYSDGSTGNVDKFGTAGVLDTGTSGSVDFNTSTLLFGAGNLSTSSAAWSQAVKVDLVNNVFVNGNDLANSLEAFNADGTKLMISKDGYSVGWGATGTPQDIHANTSSGVWAVLKDAGLIHG